MSPNVSKFRTKEIIHVKTSTLRMGGNDVAFAGDEPSPLVAIPA